MDDITRRKALEMTSQWVGGMLSASIWTGVLSGCQASQEEGWKPQFLSPEEALTASNLADVIIPKTDTPGAKEALVHRFIDEMLVGYCKAPEQQVIRSGLLDLQKRSFHRLDAEDQMSIVQQLADEATRASEPSETFFFLMRSMTLLGYFTSEVGAQQALNYDPIPGAYEGCIPVHKYGGKVWGS